MRYPVHAVVRRSFDDRATRYDDSVMHRALADAVAETASADGVRSVLDVATGTGLVLRALHARGWQATMTGVDISPGMLAVAARARPESAFVEGLAEDLPTPDASVDLVTCVTALHILPDPDAAIAEWARVLTPGGRVLTATFMRADDIVHPGSTRDYPRSHVPFADAASLGATVAPAGFAVRRWSAWTHGDDRLLIAELGRSHRAPGLTARRLSAPDHA